MRTTLDIEAGLMREVLSLTGEKGKGRAVSVALRDWVRRRRLEELKALAGKIEIVDNLKELEQLELKEMARTW